MGDQSCFYELGPTAINDPETPETPSAGVRKTRRDLALFIYNLLYFLVVPLDLLRRLSRSTSHHSGYVKNLPEKFGLVPTAIATRSQHNRPIWLHAVSVGEVRSLETLVPLLLADKHPLYITTTTPSGRDQAMQSFGDRVQHGVVPYDAAWCARLFIKRLQPKAFLTVETEVWPNFINELTRQGIPAAIVSGRLSEKSLHRLQHPLVKPVMQRAYAQLSMTLAQNSEDAARYQALNTDPVLVTGNLKLDYQLNEDVQTQAQQLADDLGVSVAADAAEKDDIVLLAGSTHSGEEEVLLNAYTMLLQQFKKLRLILVPRHPARASQVASLSQAILSESNLFHDEAALVSLRSEGKIWTGPVLVADRMGELRALYGLSDLAIIGGTFIDHGGQNPLEAAAWGLPIVCGHSQRNFAKIFDGLTEQDASACCDFSVPALVELLRSLLANPERRIQMGMRAKQYLSGHQGATAQTMQHINRWLDQQGIDRPHR